MGKYLAGDPFDTYSDDDTPQTIYQYCLHYFDTDLCPLGTSTDELKRWVESYAERNQLMSKAFEKLLGEHQLGVLVQDENGGPQLREATESDKFDFEMTTLLSNIEKSNALQEYIEQMLSIRGMLQAEAPVDEILIFLNRP